ncbi:ABC transporter permease [Roseomonas sp. OT10]|uniref:ABC transporter permease n=1 Tax=Roseomonas cutis TaxID=2897332 RepID=UPI001E372E93|nr:ABC transporter permease [Roseomonas sp. OT10]UFN48344.1 ABC transporter permease [Roseomonas sp. OT10]
MTALLAPVHSIDASDPKHLSRALEDLGEGLASWRLAWALARLDLRNRYRGSVIGPFWMTLSTAVMLVGLGFLYARLFGMTLQGYLPHLAVSLITWNVISAVVTDACTSLTSAEGVIRQLRLPYTVHALRCVFRNLLTAAHSLPLILLVFLALDQWPGAEAVLAIPGLLLLAINALSVSLFLGMLCARFRDIGPIVGSVMQLAFFMTPVIWKPELAGDWQPWLVLNPFYALLETVRGPLVEGGGPPVAWLAAFLYTALAAAGAFAFFVRFRGRVAFWV